MDFFLNWHLMGSILVNLQVYFLQVMMRILKSTQKDGVSLCRGLRSRWQRPKGTHSSSSTVFSRPSYKHQHLERLMLAPPQPTLLLEYCMVSWSCLQSTVIQTPTPGVSDAGSSTTNTHAGILHGKLIMSSINRHTNTNTWSVWCWLLHNQHYCWNTAW